MIYNPVFEEPLFIEAVILWTIRPSCRHRPAGYICSKTILRMLPDVVRRFDAVFVGIYVSLTVYLYFMLRKYILFSKMKTSPRYKTPKLSFILITKINSLRNKRRRFIHYHYEITLLSIHNH